MLELSSGDSKLKLSSADDLNAAHVESNQSFLGSIFHHVMQNAKIVASGRGTVLQDLELVGEATVLGAAVTSGAFAIAGFAIGAEALAEGSIIGAAIGGSTSLIGSVTALTDKRAELNAKKARD